MNAYTIAENLFKLISAKVVFHRRGTYPVGIACLCLACVQGVAATNPRSLPSALEAASSGSFPVFSENVAVPILYDAADAKVVEIAANLLADDLERVGGVRPDVDTTTAGYVGRVVLAGTIGGSSFIDGLIASGKIDVSGIQGQWESYCMIRIPDPGISGITEALVIAGSDRRGTAYGLGAVSEAIGVSPWIWWADVPPPSLEAIHLGGLPLNSVPPSVRYRGIFINDEDWGLQEWAEKNYESGPDEVKDLGPKSYAKIFELLLRLRANYCWPGMHPSTKAFNYYDQNKEVADDYAIVMGSSHAEPMLRNNVDEWDDFCSANGYSTDWNYANNKSAVYDYWDTRAQENGAYDSVYTVGKRGIHDSGMVEGSTTAEKAAWLNTIFTDQREILANRVNPSPDQVPQTFVPYKEVLDIYDSGLVNVPDDVTLVWPDDNHGYIRRLSNNAEQLRSGGGGVYYHLSYWGSPQDYLWLSTTPPALIWEEMTKAYDNNCRRLWVFNIGDIKPCEIPMEFALRLAWNVDDHGPNSQMEWLIEWATREFGANRAGAIASVMNDYFLLNHRRRPEHMDWKDDDPGYPLPHSGKKYPLFSHVHAGDEVAQRLEEFSELRQRADAIYAALPATLLDAFYQLVVYPVRGSDAMNRKFLHTSLAYRGVAQKRKSVAADSAVATSAYNEIGSETVHYNTAVASGKWNEMMDWRPRRLSVFNLPDQPADPGPQSVGLGVAIEGRLTPVFTTDNSGATGALILLHAVDDATLAAPMQEATLDGRRCTWTPGTGGYVLAGAGGRATYSFTNSVADTYEFQFEVRTPNPEDDSWWIELDGSTPQKWNDLGLGNPVGWEWATWDTRALGVGAHTLVVHEREDGAAMAAIRMVPTTTASVEEIGEDDRFVDFQLPEFNSITRRSFFVDLINTEVAPLAWSTTVDDPWVVLSESSGELAGEQRLDISIDWSQLPVGENLQSTIRFHQGTNTIDVLIAVWNPATPPAADFIEENGVVVVEAEHVSSSIPGTDATWQSVPGMGNGSGVMVVSPTTAPSLSTPAEILADAPVLEYSFHLRTAGTHLIKASFLPALALNNERGRRYAVSIDSEAPQIAELVSNPTDNAWKRSVLRANIEGISTHAIATPGLHTLKIWMVDPGVILDRIVIEIEGSNVPSTYNGLRETTTDPHPTLRIREGETFILDQDASYGRIINYGTLVISSSNLSLEGDLVNFGTVRIIGSSSIDGGNVTNFDWLDTMGWATPSLPNYSGFGNILDASAFYIDGFWMDSYGAHVQIPAYEGHRYSIFRSTSLDPMAWIQSGTSQDGTGAFGAPVPLLFDWPTDATQMFFRVELD